MNDATQRNFTRGDLLAGKYRVEGVIGEGGMGIVLAAHHEALATNVAIKLLRSDALEHTDIVGRFVREARATVSLRSEHVARVFDIGELEDGRPYIVMERLEGQDFGAVIAQGPELPIADVVDYVMQACEAVAEAHSLGIVHRDLKPKNLFLTRAVHGRPLVKVLDFGISKMAPKSPDEMQLTRTTEVIGSPSYMSPEQLRSSRNVDARTDVWALGVILYELLTKRLPFYAETVTELVLVVATEREPPVRSLRPDCPEALEAIVARCLRKSPDERFQNVLELVQLLEPLGNSVQATITERIRGVAASSRALPPSPSSSGDLMPPTVPIPGTPIPGTPIPGMHPHVGTSVAWGATQSAVSPTAPFAAPPPPPARSNALIAVALAGVFALGLAAGGTMYFLKRSPTASASSPTVTADTKPATAGLPSSIAPEASAAPSPSSLASVAAAAPSASSSERKAETKPTPAAVKNAGPARRQPGPAPTDDLSNIERR